MSRWRCTRWACSSDGRATDSVPLTVMNDESPEAADLRTFVEATLGAGSIIDDRSRPFGKKSLTWRVTAKDGRRFFAKRHEVRQQFDAELLALTEWAPLIESNDRWASPEVISVSSDQGAMIMTALDGEPLEDQRVDRDVELSMYRTAGWLAARIHELDVGTQGIAAVRDLGDDAADRALEGAEELFDADTVHWIRSVALVPGEFDGLVFVPTHSDFSPRNWLVGTGTQQPVLGLIDWERAQESYWLEDLQRMVYDHWRTEPWRRHAFFEGYGRKLTAAEEHQLRLICLLDAVYGLKWATSHDDFAYVEFLRSVIDYVRVELG